MICRQQGRELILIGQYDHSRLSGELARKIGNALFAPPSPFDSVIHAIAEHDCGWVEADAHPSANPTGRPAHIFEMDVLISISAWEKSVEQTISHDTYAGLLVSLHTMALATHASSRQGEPHDEFARQRLFRIRRFIHQQIETQEQLRRRLEMRTDLPLRGGLAEEGRAPEEDLLRTNFFLLEFLDQLSLNLCFGRLVFPRIETLHPRPGADAISAHVGLSADGRMMLNPWPFNCPRFEMDIPAKRISAGPFRDPKSLQAACESAANCFVRVVLEPIGS
jgi:hypothetical protein